MSALDDAENKAAYAAMRVYLATLQAELEKQGTGIMAAFARTSHDHLAVVLGDMTGVVRMIVAIDTTPATAAATLRAHASKIAGAKVT